MVKVRTVKKDYPVTNRPVFFSVNIGEGQMGSSVAMLDNELLKVGEIKNLNLGEGAALVGKTLRVKSLVSDTNDMTNRVSIGYRLTGGAEDWDGKVTETVEREGDSVIFRLAVRFLTSEDA